MNITLHLMSVDEKALLIRLMELYDYEFSAFINDDINEYGYYGYDHIDDYWNEEGRSPYLIRVDGVREGLQQYYDIEQTTDLWSLNSGRVQAKLGVNEKTAPAKTPASFVLIDDRHLAETGVRYFCARSKQLVIATSNRSHPAFQVDEPNLLSSIKISWISAIC